MEAKSDVCCDHSENEEEDAKQNSDMSLVKLNPTPTKKLLILSMGGVLCHRVCLKDNVPACGSGSPDVNYGRYIVYKRPYCEEFIKFCLERFEVAIWSSAREWYLNGSLDCVMGGLTSKLLFAWDQNECTNSGFVTLENKKKPIFFKELSQVWEDMGRYSSSNTLLIDNEPYKALLNPPHTAIFPTEYKGDNQDNALGPEGELRLYLESLANAEDVPSYIEKNPIGQPAISPDHPKWHYYSRIIQRVRGD